jgi:formylglycine-generating enzyme required for sulfatase activity
MGGKNPSHFTGDPQLPVEQVSWDDVQGFLTRLQIFMPQGVQAVLPTEAEWEYACRADSTTQFSFGDVIGSQQVNFNGSYTGVIVDKGESRGTTIPVRALAPNHWGLYQMHGNVREWCADSLRQYSSELEINPTGASDQQVKSFAVRGGSWFHDALNSRSALRYFNQRFRHNFDLGFRIALRTTERGLRSSILDVGGRRQLEALDAPDSWDKA